MRWILWIVLGSLVAGIGWIAAHKLYPRWFYTDLERYYFEGLEQAMREGKTHVPLRELLPFNWTSMCFVSAPYYKIGDEEAAEVKRVTNVDISKWFERDEYPTIMLVTPVGVVRLRDFSWQFEKIRHVEQEPFYKSYYVGYGYDVTVRQTEENEEQYVFCDEEGRQAYVKIKKL